MSWGCHWNCCAKNWRYWDNGGAGCGPRDGRRIKHEGAKTRSDDDEVIHTDGLRDKRRTRRDARRQEAGVRRRATIIHRPDRHRDKLRAQRDAEWRCAIREDDAKHKGATTRSDARRRESGDRRQEVPMSGSCLRGLSRRLGRFWHPCLNGGMAVGFQSRSLAAKMATPQQARGMAVPKNMGTLWGQGVLGLA